MQKDCEKNANALTCSQKLESGMAVSFSSSDSSVSFYSFNFWDCNLIPFLPPIWPCPLCSKPLFFYQLLHAFANTYIFLNITCCVHIMLLNTYVFRTDHLALDSQLVCSSLGRAPLLLLAFTGQRQRWAHKALTLHKEFSFYFLHLCTFA